MDWGGYFSGGEPSSDRGVDLASLYEQAAVDGADVPKVKRADDLIDQLQDDIEQDPFRDKDPRLDELDSIVDSLMPPEERVKDALGEKGKALTTKRRNNLDTSQFAIPETRSYPIDTPNRARNALSRVAQNGTPEEQRRVKAAVKKKYPDIGQS